MKKTRVFVGMSGGVDSSLTAALLVEQGYDVVGVYMKNWSQDLPGADCPWANDLADAKRVAVQLDIDFRVYDFEKDYKDKVVKYMVESYKRGQTPNPDIMCNQEVKFKLFLETALKDGADLIATGHYARTKDGKLILAEDENKDQTYFLHRVDKKALEKTLFPLGNFKKTTVRQMATDRGLTTAGKKDSQGICFVGQIGIKEFLGQYVELSAGEIIDEKSKKVLGYHDGAIFYTLGQRHGLDLSTGNLPYYVVGKSMSKNEVYVSSNLNTAKLWQEELKLSDMHSVSGQAFASGEYLVRTRHRAPLAKAELLKKDGEIWLKLAQPQRAVALGQSAVIYKNGVCLGGGVVAGF